VGPREIILTTFVPGLIVGVPMLVAWLLHARREEPGRGPVWIAPIVFGIAFAVASWAVDPLARWWPHAGSQRLPHVAAVAVLAGLGSTWLHRSAIARHAFAVTSLAIAIWAVIGSLPPQTLARTDLAIWIISIALGGSVVLLVTDATAGRGSTRTDPARIPAWLPAMQFALVALAASLVCLFSKIGIFAMLAGTLVAISTAASIVGMICRKTVYWPGGTLFLYTIIAALCVGASQYAQYPLHLSAYVLVLIAPLGVLAARLTKDPGTARWKPVVLSFVGVLLPSATAIIIALATRHVSVPYDF
jgi:hypothetical protein